MSDQSGEQQTAVQERVGRGYDTPRSSTLGGTLPCGYLDETGVVHETFVVQEMTGADEDILAGKAPVLARLNAVIANRLISVGTLDLVGRRELAQRIVAQLTAMDRTVILIALRRISLGDLYDMRTRCPECGRESTYAVDLAGLEVQPMMDRTQREWQETMPSGRTIRWHVLRNEDEEWLAQRAKKDEDEKLTLSLLARVTGVDGQTIDRTRDIKGARDMLRGLAMRDRQWFRRQLETREGGVDDSVEFECSVCGHEWVGELEMAQAGFFFPSVI